MKMISSETKKILNKLYNLRGEDSKVIQYLLEEKRKTKDIIEKDEETINTLNEKISTLTTDISDYSKEGSTFKDFLTKINSRDSIARVLEVLNIDFQPESYLEKIDVELPKIIQNLESDKEVATSNLQTITEDKKQNEAILQELEIKNEDALFNQNKLNEYIKSALASDISSVTRDEITDLLEKIKVSLMECGQSLSDEEIREITKLIMFPEDALLDYDEYLKKNADFEKVEEVEIANQEFEVEEQEEKIEEEAVEPEEEIVDTPVENAEVVEEEKFDDSDVVEEKIETEEPSEEKGIFDTFDSLINDIEPKKDFDNKKVLESKNINISLEEYPKLENDEELEQKINYLLEIGKTPEDISRVANILVKYSYEELVNTIDERSNELNIAKNEISLVSLEYNNSFNKDLLSDITEKDHSYKYLVGLYNSIDENVKTIRNADIPIRPGSYKVLSLPTTTIKKNIQRAEMFGFLDAYKQNLSFISHDAEKIANRITECETKNIPYKNDKDKYQAWLFSDRGYKMVVPSDTPVKEEVTTDEKEDDFINVVANSANKVIDSLNELGINLEDNKNEIFANIIALAENGLSGKEILMTVFTEYVDNQHKLNEIVDSALNVDEDKLGR